MQTAGTPAGKGNVLSTLISRKMKSLKLNQLDSQRLAEKEMLNVQGGQGNDRCETDKNGKITRWCGCGCLYEGNGGASTNDNMNANFAGGSKGLYTPGYLESHMA